ncbi:hypothetical protein [Nocardia sp. NPDC004415]
MSEAQREHSDAPHRGGAGSAPHPRPPRTGLIVAGVLGLVVGVVIGFLVRGAGDKGGTDADAAPSPTTYSMNGITNACDLLDPTPLTQWATRPKRDPVHTETPPSANSLGRLECEVDYTSTVGDDYSFDRAAMVVAAEFTHDESAPSHFCTMRASGDIDMGLVTDIGTRGCWMWETYGDLVPNMTYEMEVQDRNMMVRVRIDLTREPESPAVSRHDLDTVARAQVRLTFDRLRQS